MSIDLGEICLIIVFLMSRFGSVGKIKTVNQTKSCGWVRKWSKYIQTKYGF